MAKIIKTFEGKISKTEVQFLGRSFTLTMKPTSFGAESIEKSLDVQVRDYGESANIEIPEYILEAVDSIDYSDDEDILQYLVELNEFEVEIGYHAD